MKYLIREGLDGLVIMCAMVILVLVAGGIIIGVGTGLVALAQTLGMNTVLGYGAMIVVLCSIASGVSILLTATVMADW